MQSLAEAQVMMQKPAAALDLYQQIVERQEASGEKLSAVPFGYYVRVAQLRNDLGQTEAALTAFQEVAKKCPTVYGKNSIMETVYLSQCAQLLAALNRNAEAVELCERIVAQSVERDGDDHETTQNARIGLGGALQRIGKHDEAIEQYDMALAKLRAKLGDDPSRRLNAEKQIAAGYELAGRYAAAEPLHRNHLAVTERTTGKDSPATGSALAQLGLNLLQQEKWGDAEAALRPCLAIRQKLAADDWLTFSTMSMLGGALLGQKKYADAQPLLVDGVAGLEARAKQIPATGRVRYREAIERMVKLYQATNHPELAAEWSQKLQTLQAAVP